MADEKIVIRGILRHYWRQGISARATTKKICEIEGPGIVSKTTAAEWFKRFNEGDTSLEDKSRSGRPSVPVNETLLQSIQQKPHTSTRELASDIGTSQSTIVRHLHELGFANKKPRFVCHELSEQQAQRREEICKTLMNNPKDNRFWRRIITGDEKWIYLRNPIIKRQWLQPGQKASPVAKKGRFEHKVMLSIWWNFEGPVFWELIPEGRAVDGNLYAKQLERVYDVLVKRYPALINRKRVFLQHDNAPAHKSKVVKSKLEELDGIELLPHPAYSPDLAPSDYHLFRSMSHFLMGKKFNSVTDVESGILEFLQSKPPEWYQKGIQNLAERWLKTIANEGLYFEE